MARHHKAAPHLTCGFLQSLARGLSGPGASRRPRLAESIGRGALRAPSAPCRPTRLMCQHDQALRAADGAARRLHGRAQWDAGAGRLKTLPSSSQRTCRATHVLLASLARQSAAACPLRRSEALAFSLRSLDRSFLAFSGVQAARSYGLGLRARQSPVFRSLAGQGAAA